MRNIYKTQLVIFMNGTTKNLVIPRRRTAKLDYVTDFKYKKVLLNKENTLFIT